MQERTNPNTQPPRNGAVQAPLAAKEPPAGLVSKRSFAPEPEPDAAAESFRDLRRSEARYRTIVEQSSDLICRFLPDGTLTFINQTYCRYFGRSREELIGHPFLELIPVAERGAVEAMLCSFSPEMAPVSVEHRVLSPEGTTRWNRWTNSAVHDDEGLFLEYQAVGQDITETRLIQDALHEARQLAEKSNQVISSLLYVFDLARQQNIFVNQSVAALFDYPEETTQPQGQDFLTQCMHPADREHFAVHLRSLEQLGDGQVAEVEFRIRHCDGSWRWLHSREVVFSRQANGAVGQIIGTATDITERRQVEEALRKTQADLEKAQAIGQVGSWISDIQDHGQLEWSHQTLQIFGLAPGQFDGRVESFFRFIHSEDQQLVRQAAQDALMGERDYNIEHRIVRSDGSVRWVQELAEVERDAEGNPVRMVGVVRDITEYKRATQSAQRLAAFPELNPNPVLEFSKDGQLRYHNAAALRMAQSLHHEHPQDILPPDIAKIIRECLEGHRSELVLDLAVGQRFFVWSFYPIPETKTVHCYVFDVTERRQLEDQLFQVQKLESIGQLAAGVAHDFNNILTIILGDAALIAEGPNEENVADLAQEISSAGERAANLTRQLLLFSRKQRLQPQSVDLNALTSNLTKILGRLLGEDITLDFSYDTSVPLVQGDPGMLEQVIMNLAVNARDAMPQGGRLHIKTQKALRKPDDSRKHVSDPLNTVVCLTVSDTGCGIPPDIQDRIFEPFFTTKAIGQGTGLGLATVYGIVQQHGGWIELSSTVGMGSSFRIFLPAETQTRVQTVPSQQPCHRQGNAETILLVEDEPALRELISRILTNAGYCVISASSGAEAQQIPDVQLTKVILLITDMLMPGGITGLELAKQMRQNYPHLRVLYMSGYSPDANRTYLPPEDMVRFIPKPFFPQSLLNMISELIEGRNSTSSS